MKKYYKSNLTPAKKKFAQVFAQTDNATEAVKQAYPELAAHSSDKYLTLKGGRLIANDSVMNEIANRRKVMEQNATRAAHRIKELIESDKEDIALKASIFSYEQEEGRAITQIQATSTSVNLSINLSTEDID